MKTLSDNQLQQIVGPYDGPVALYQYTKSLPFLGEVTSDVCSLIAGQWTEIRIHYTVGGLGTISTSNPSGDSYISAEYLAGELVPGQTPATVQDLAIRFDQKGHERPFQKAIIIDIRDGYLNPGDKIIVRLGDRRFGGKGTRVQSFIEDRFAMRWYIDPVGTSRFAAIKPVIFFDIQVRLLV